jgi:hypothetical protein
LFKKLDYQTLLRFGKSKIDEYLPYQKRKVNCYYRFLYLPSPEIVNGCKAKQTTAIKYCKSEQIKATMVNRTRQNRFCTAAYQIGLLILLRHIPDYFSYHLQNEVIFAPQHVPDYSGVV